MLYWSSYRSRNDPIDLTSDDDPIDLTSDNDPIDLVSDDDEGPAQSDLHDMCHEEKKKREIPSATSTGNKGQFTFRKGQVFTMGARIGGGRYGDIFKGTFGKDGATVPIAIKVPIKVPIKVNRSDSSENSDSSEFALQTSLFCMMRASAFKHVRDFPTSQPMAKIPKPYFACRTREEHVIIGMEALDATLINHVLQRPLVQRVAVLSACVRQLSCLLDFLQRANKFAHNDMHANNVMLRGDKVYLIDYGMSSYTTDEGTRVNVDTAYDGVPFNPTLDLLILLTSAMETFARNSAKAPSLWCAAIVMPFWTAVKEELVAGNKNKDLRKDYGNLTRVLRNFRRRNGAQLRQAAHLLYFGDGGNVDYAATAPKNMIEYIDTHKWGKVAPDQVAGWHRHGVFRVP